MNQNDLIDLLKETLSRMDDAAKWLERSRGICQKIGIKESYEDGEYDAFETLTSRFARASDMLLQKVFRAIDRVELEEGGTLLDVLNRAEKRGLEQKNSTFTPPPHLTETTDALGRFIYYRPNRFNLLFKEGWLYAPKRPFFCNTARRHPTLQPTSGARLWRFFLLQLADGPSGGKYPLCRRPRADHHACATAI